jgi:hypothetical protein
MLLSDCSYNFISEAKLRAQRGGGCLIYTNSSSNYSKPGFSG